MERDSRRYEGNRPRLACVTKLFDNKVGAYGETFNAWLNLLLDGGCSSIVEISKKKTIFEGRVFSLHDQDRAEYLMNSVEFKD